MKMGFFGKGSSNMYQDQMGVIRASIVASLCLMATAGCDGRPSRIHPPRVNAAAAAEEAMKQYDANHDGKIDQEELKNCTFFSGLAKDGGVTAEAIAAEINRWTESKIGRVGWKARISHGGKPLENAAVKMIPEKFLGANVIAGEGVTNKSGVVMPSVPTKRADEIPGISLGFYRLQITKDGENIPAKYNTESTLCVLVAGGQGAGAAEIHLVY
jgi:hypothetical protein